MQLEKACVQQQRPSAAKINKYINIYILKKKSWNLCFRKKRYKIKVVRKVWFSAIHPHLTDVSFGYVNFFC